MLRIFSVSPFPFPPAEVATFRCNESPFSIIFWVIKKRFGTNKNKALLTNLSVRALFFCFVPASYLL